MSDVIKNEAGTFRPSEHGVIGDNGHEYPSKYYPGQGHWYMDEAWEILDTIKPGLIPHDVRSAIAGMIGGTLIKIANKYKHK